MIEVLKNPRDVGALAPTSANLADVLVAEAGVRDAAHIIELGAGAGAVTTRIVRAMRPNARLLAIERHPRLAAKLTSRFPDVSVREGCASRVGQLAGASGFPDADCIVSALPWTNFPDPMQGALLHASRDVLRPGGVFTTFACLGPHRSAAGRRLRGWLEMIFPEVSTTRVVWMNFPPAFVYRCVRR
ncbi:MAG: methyltransferase domain-containing protein [Terrimicrobiaceae bacterium]|nr:methyltransferase domain-containing protein [Terrimicrobiaceae bacterium]